MALARSFRDTVVKRAQLDAEFRSALIQESVQAFLGGRLAETRSLLRGCINATIGFADLSAATHTPVKSLMRMVGPNGNPSAQKIGAVFRALQDHSGVRARVEVEAALKGSRASSNVAKPLHR